MNRLDFFYWEFRYQLLKWWWNRTSKQSAVNGIALMYHHVTNECIDALEACKCTIQEFCRVMEMVSNEGREFVSVDKMMCILSEKSFKKFAVVTFDDVPGDFYTNAYPILKEKKIPFVLFITTSYIDKSGYLTKEQLLELDADPLCTIGAHTLTHPMLRRVNNSLEELTESKMILEKMLGHTIDYMAYPYGRQSSVSKRVMGEARRAGYRCSFGTIHAPMTDNSCKNLYYLPRMVIK